MMRNNPVFRFSSLRAPSAAQDAQFKGDVQRCTINCRLAVGNDLRDQKSPVRLTKMEGFRIKQTLDISIDSVSVAY